MEARHQYQGISLLGAYLCTCGAKAATQQRITDHIAYYTPPPTGLTTPATGSRPLDHTPGFATGGVTFRGPLTHRVEDGSPWPRIEVNQPMIKAAMVELTQKDRELFKALTTVKPGEKVTKKADVVDMVNHPSHYTRKIEVLDFIEAYGLHHFAYLKDAVKYIARHQFKGSPLQDLKKARFYLDRHIKNLEAEGVTE